MVAFTQHDLQFILDGITVSEDHADQTNLLVGGTWTQSDIEASRQILRSLLPNSLEPIGMRTISGELNNLEPLQDQFGATGNEFPRLTDEVHPDDGGSGDGTGNPDDDLGVDLNGPAVPGGELTNTDYGVPGSVVDSDPRIISNLVVDQSVRNPAALVAAGIEPADFATDPAAALAAAGFVDQLDGNWLNEETGAILIDPDGPGGALNNNEFFFLPNVAPDEGLSAPFNAWMTFFGQFFDHGLDFIPKQNNGTIFIPLAADDPLRTLGPDGIAGNGDEVPPQLAFIAVTRAEQDLIGGQDPINLTSPFVDQNQTYTSHPSHQIFVREYVLQDIGDGERPYATGELLEGIGDGMATWGEVKAQAATALGIELTDAEALDIPLFAVDQYGEFLRGPTSGLPQMVLASDADPSVTILVEGNLADPVSVAEAEADNAGFSVVPTGFSFLLDIAHNANPIGDHDGDPSTPPQLLTADGNPDIGPTSGPGSPVTGEYDDELLDAHFIAGDGRVNENIALTAVHHVFHQEHNRVVEHTKDVLLANENPQGLATAEDPTGNDAALALLNSYLLVEVGSFAEANAAPGALVWNGDRLFQAAKFATEMQYQHLVFEEFGRKVQPLIDIFASFEPSIDASITMEFSQAVYRFGHSMLTENVDLIDDAGNLTEVGLVQAFLNPLGFNPTVDENGLPTVELGAGDSAVAAGALARGLVRETGNQIDEHVTEALRNNLLGLPLDLAAINIARGRDVGLPKLQEVRETFFEGTGDTKLKPYDSWVDFALHAKNEWSVVNFIAAYGQHDVIRDAADSAEARANALALVTGDLTGTTLTAGQIADRSAFLNSTGAWDVENGGLESGLNLVDLWIGGLAEATEPFGGMLGSTFNFVFEEQMEDLQDGDRFYYLGRTAGLNFLTQLEQNSFAGMISRNTDIGETGWHLPGDIFARVNYILEVDQSVQFNEGLGSADPSDGGSLFGIEMVIRDNPQTTAIDTNFLQFTGGDHVVIGGTNPGNPINVTGADHLIGGIGDDTIYGDGGDDTIEGGDGSDILLGGSGDDIITDIGGEDNIQGQDGNDYIFSGAGEDLILAGAGKDFVLGGPDLHETFGGLGDDFIHMGSESIIAFGGEGNDWMEGGGGNNLMQGDNGDPFLNSTVGGHDVFISGQGDDDYDSEGGDDIMEGADGVQRFEGLNGFDWATYKDVDLGVNVDMLLRAFDETPIPPSNASIFDRFDTVEGLSGGRGSDILRGDDEDRLTIETLNNGNNSVLSGDDRFEQIHGLREGDNGGAFDAGGPNGARYNPIFNTVAGERTTEWGEGDIILGGAGSDLIEGRGGDDIIDGDLKLDVRLVIRNSDGDAIATAFKMEGQLYAVNTDGVPIDAGGTPLASNARDGLTPVVIGGFSNLDDAVANRAVNPGDIHIFREIIDESGGVGFDTAEFSDARDNYTISGPDADGFITVSHDDPVLGAGQGADGVDRVRNVERLQFADQTVELVTGGNTLAAAGATIVVDATGVEAGPADIFVGQTLRADPSSIIDADGTDNSIFIHFWQFEEEPGSGVFLDFEIFNGSGEAGPLEGAVIDVPPEAEGFALRVKTIFQDDDGVFETVFSDPTEPAAPEVSTDPTPGDDNILGTVGIDIIDALAGDDVISSLAGNDVITGGPGSDIIDGGADIDTAVFSGDVADFLFATPEEAAFDLEIVDTLTDDEDLVVNVEFLQFDTNTSDLFGGATTIAVSDILGGQTIFGTPGADTLVGTEFDDTIDGRPETGGPDAGDVIDGAGGDDNIFGRGGADEIEGGEGDDFVRGNGGNDIIGWRPGEGRDLINGGGNGALGDTVDIRTNGAGDTLRVWAVEEAADRAAFLTLFPGETLRGATEIVMTYDPADGTGEAVIAEIWNVEELVINAVPIAPGVDPDGTNIAIIGDFTDTSLNLNTITINGSFNDETVDISQLTSDHRIVFNPGGGNDMIIGDLRPQDVVNAQGGTTVTDNGDGTTTIDGPDIYRPAAFNLTATDLAELKKLVNGEESELAEDFATGVRTLSGHGNNVLNEEYGASDEPFIRLTDARYGDKDEAIGNYDLNPIFHGLDPRSISDYLGTQESDLGKSAEGANIFFMSFGQYFDHGLDFLPKDAANGTVAIGNPGPVDIPPLDLTRGSVNDIVGGVPEHLNMASPFVDQNQAYGSHELVGQFLREGDGAGGLTARLLAGQPDPSNDQFNLLPNLRELIEHHWDNDTVFKGINGDPSVSTTFQAYYSDFVYNMNGDMASLIENGEINRDVLAHLNADFMGSGHTIVGDNNPGIDLLDHYVAGDLRANENYALTSMHTIWARNHNYHVDNLTVAGFDGSAEEYFQAAKILNETEYQRVVFTEFADKLLGGLEGSGEHGHDDYDPTVDARITHEFAAAVYRVGHSLISQTMTVYDNDGNARDVPLTEAFLNPTNDNPATPGYGELGVNGVVRGTAGQLAEEVDFNLVDAIRDNLQEIPFDLFSLNVARGRDVGLGTLNQVKKDLMESNDPYVKEAVELSDADMTPYSSWADFRDRNNLSPTVIAQFMMAYPDLDLNQLSQDERDAFEDANPDIEVINGIVKGIDRVDLWVGGLAEKHINDGVVGATFWVVLHEQFDRLQQGDRFYYFDRTEDFDFYQQVEDQSFADIIARNTGLEGLSDDVFTTEVDDDDQDDDDNQDDGDDQDDDNDQDDDSDQGDDDSDSDDSDSDQGSDSGSGGSTTADVPLTLIGDAASNTMFGGSAGDMISGLGSSDTLVSGDGNDTVVGGEGDDNVIGGEGDDLLIGEGGNDTILGGAGNDFILGGDGADQILAGGGNDWINAGGDRDVVDGGAGDDTMVAALGDGDDVYRGGDGVDTLDMAAITADAFVDLNTGQAVSGQSGNDSISDFENVITGAGSDTIVANASVNVMTGGADEDMFVFNSIADADGDHITDFAPGDTIDLSGIASNYNFDTADGNFELLTDGTTMSKAGQLVVRSDGSDLLVDGHVDADGTADFTIRVSGKSDLDQSDFG